MFCDVMTWCILLFSLFSNLVEEDTASAWPYQHVDKASKLSNSAITSVYMDKYDHVWLGTWDGLDLYDGSFIKVYKPDPFLKGTISNNIIRNFLEDSHGNLWVITHQGINKYNRSTDTFKSYLDSVNDIPFLEYNIRACVGPDSVIWVSLIGKGIKRYSAKSDNFLPVELDGINDAWLSTVVDIGSHQGLLYLLGSDGKISCTVNNRQVYSKKIFEPSEVAFHRFLRIGESYFLVIAQSNGRLMFYNLTQIEQNPEVIALGKVNVSSLTENVDHTAVWIGTEEGDIFKVSLSSGGLELKSMNLYFPKLAKSKIKVLTITETGQDLVWIGTDGDGVYKFLTRPKVFYSIHAGSAESGELSHDIIRSVYENQSTGVLYVGTRGGGLNIIKPDKPTAVLNTSSGLSNNAVLALNKDKYGNIWIGVDGEGIDMLEEGSGKILHFPRDFTTDNSIKFSSVYSICIDAFNDLWLGTSGYGVIHLNVNKISSGKYRLDEYDEIHHLGNSGQTSLRSNVVYSIVEEKPNTLWFGTRGGGVYRYNSLTKKIEEHIQSNAADRNSLCNDDVLSMRVGKNEELWVGTSGGLNLIDLHTRPYRVTRYTEYEGLPNNTIHGILEDVKGNLWLSTNHGLVIYDRVTNIFKTYDTNDGLQNNEFTDGAVYQSLNSKRLFFGGIDGLDIVYPQQLSDLNYFPRLTVTDFQIRNKSVIPGDDSKILKENIDFTREITLTYDQNFISFYFTTLNYWNKHKSEYFYKLENFDKEWNHIDQQQSITFTNILPGNYTLLINYANDNGEWSASPRVIKITVTPPFWKTSWAYAFYMMLAIGLQVGIILYIRWRLRVKKLMAMDKFRAGQLKELNDYKLQFFTNIAHEFRTPLTLILGPVTSLLQKSSTVSDTKQLKTIYSNSLRLQKLIEELIQFRKIESGKDSLRISQVELVSFTQKIVESFYHHAAEREITLEFHPEPELLLAYVDFRKVEKILINLISNAIKYSIKGGSVRVSLREQDGNVIFAVRDEGVGIPEENKEKIFESFYQNPSQLNETNALAKSTGIGLSLTKSLVMIHHGNINVISKPEKGSTFTVTIPIKKQNYPDSTEEVPVILLATNLGEKISLEFEADHLLVDQPEKIANTIIGKSPYSILVVDDNAQITSLLKNILSDKYLIHKAANGRKALAVLEEERIDLVISDILMPDMDGLSLCKKIKENIQTSHIPVILLTAKVEIENRIEGLQVGADSYIPKPFHPQHLFIRIEKLIEKSELIRKKFQNVADLELNSSPTGISETDDTFFSKITLCILRHLNEHEFNADTIADEVGMSKASLYKKVKTITGLTPHGLIKQYRLRKAADLLKNSNMSVSEVIEETGFNSRSYFYKSFNEMFHCHPKDFGNQPAE